MTARIRPLVTAVLLPGLLLAMLPAAGQAAEPAPICIHPFSKNLCSGELSRGVWGLPTCPAGDSSCNNLVGVGASFQSPLTTSGGVCGGPFALAPCDTAPEFTGTLAVDVGLRSQRHVACKARGSWEGPFRIFDTAGLAIATGDLMATLGMGTHRKAECHGGSCGKDCEGCHDATLDEATLRWQIGSEGTLRGKVLFGRYAGCTFTASFQGDFDANGDTRGPLPPHDTWRFCGTLEGVLECPCPCSTDGASAAPAGAP